MGSREKIPKENRNGEMDEYDIDKDNMLKIIARLRSNIPEGLTREDAADKETLMENVIAATTFNNKDAENVKKIQ